VTSLYHYPGGDGRETEDAHGRIHYVSLSGQAMGGASQVGLQLRFTLTSRLSDIMASKDHASLPAFGGGCYGNVVADSVISSELTHFL